MRQYSYLAVLVAILAATLPLERLLGARVLAQGRRLALTLLIGAAPFLCWDFYAVSQDHWSFDAEQTVGAEVPGGLPIEEVAFFVVIPLAILFTFEAVHAVRRRFS
ncbi:lycopene cyclase domain-containing protein [Sporichthya sp.]|uniref:lycopene cyclase domain-containing protein n=1 Tax=Sporichthya sp. TaxID=65475 RepID=UPI00184C146E|nr:lycopene cyclase domain-containing protein [Sporichthya sp.]MBA3745139.1 lycopene cyclase domain-containing protein [Sporichthya sp.]